MAPDTRVGGDPNPSHQSLIEEVHGRIPADWTGIEGDPDWGDLSPGSDVGPIKVPPSKPPEETPEPDSLPEVIEATYTGDPAGEGQEADAVSEAEDIDQAVSSVPPHLWANPEDYLPTP